MAVVRGAVEPRMSILMPAENSWPVRNLRPMWKGWMVGRQTLSVCVVSALPMWVAKGMWNGGYRQQVTDVTHHTYLPAGLFVIGSISMRDGQCRAN